MTVERLPVISQYSEHVGIYISYLFLRRIQNQKLIRKRKNIIIFS
jgi:hypothetical protein